jgi:hypothetical protein
MDRARELDNGCIARGQPRAMLAAVDLDHKRQRDALRGGKARSRFHHQRAVSGKDQVGTGLGHDAGRMRELVGHDRRRQQQVAIACVREVAGLLQGGYRQARR